MGDDFNSFVEWAATGRMPVPPLIFWDRQEQAGCLFHSNKFLPQYGPNCSDRQTENIKYS